MKDFAIKKFGSKMMIGSRALNTVPDEYLDSCQNCRIDNWWLAPRKWKTILTTSVIWTWNKGAFTMWWKLYQVTNSKIYEINTTNGTQTEKATLSYDSRVDQAVYKDKAIIVSSWKDLQVFNGSWLETQPTTVPYLNSWIIEYLRWYSFLAWWSNFTINNPWDTWVTAFFWVTESLVDSKFEYIQQSFTIAESISNIRIQVNLKKVWAPTDDINIWIYKSSDNSLVTSIWNIWGPLITTSYTNQIITLTWTLTLTTVWAYYIKFWRSTTLSWTDYYAIQYWDSYINWTSYPPVWIDPSLIVNFRTKIDWWIETSKLKNLFTPSVNVTNPILDLVIKKVWAPVDNFVINIKKVSDNSTVIWPVNISWWSLTTTPLLYSTTLTWNLISWTNYYIELSRSWWADWTNYYYLQWSNYPTWTDYYYYMPTASWTLNLSYWIALSLRSNTFIYGNFWDIRLTLDWTYSTIAPSNILYISRPITAENSERAYDFTGSWSQNITFDKEILWLKSTMTWLYIFTDWSIEYLWANSLQNVSWSATFISQPLWDSSWPINNSCITASWDKIFYISKNLQVQTVNFIWWTDWTSIWELSARPIIWIKELLNTFDTSQPTAIAFYNENDKTIQFHLRTVWSSTNNKVLVYDLINDTWNIDTNKNYTSIVRLESQYYGFTDWNSNIYKDDIWYNDNWTAIAYEIKIGHNIWTNQSIFWGFYLKGWIKQSTNLTIKANVDWNEVFNNTITWSSYPLSSWLNIFDKRATQSQIYRLWQRIEYIISSSSTTQDFILDWLGTTAEPTNFNDTWLNNW